MAKPLGTSRDFASAFKHFQLDNRELVLKDGEVEQLMADAAAAIKRPEFAHLSQCVVWGDHGLPYLKRGCPTFVALGFSRKDGLSFIKCVSSEAELHAEVALCMRLAQGEAFVPKLLGFRQGWRAVELELPDGSLGWQALHLVQYKMGAFGSLRFTIRLQAEGKVDVSAARLLAWLHRMAEALSLLHAMDCVHGDFKPDNIVTLSRSNRREAYLIGGATMKRAQPADGLVYLDPCRDSWTPGFTPPEAVVDGYSGKPTDLFALGMTIFEVFNGVNWGEGDHALSSVHQRRMIEEQVQAGGSFATTFTRSVGIPPALAYVANLTALVMTGVREHLPDVSWCVALLGRLQLAMEAYDQGTAASLILYLQHLIQATYSLAIPAPPFANRHGTVIPLRQLEPATVLAVHAFLQQLMRHREGQVTYHAVDGAGLEPFVSLQGDVQLQHIDVPLDANSGVIAAAFAASDHNQTRQQNLERERVYLDEMAGRVREAQGELLDQTAQPWVFEAAQSMGRTTFEVMSTIRLSEQRQGYELLEEAAELKERLRQFAAAAGGGGGAGSASQAAAEGQGGSGSALQALELTL